jgi:hypothetical protein
VKHGRKTPYTEIGIRRMSCVRCGKRASSQWQVCADGNTYRPLCSECDILVNRLVLIFMRDPDWKEKVAAYAYAKELAAHT